MLRAKPLTRDAYVEAVTIRRADGQFMVNAVMGYRCRLVDEEAGLDLLTLGSTSDRAAMRALGIVTGCYWQYAA